MTAPRVTEEQIKSRISEQAGGAFTPADVARIAHEANRALCDALGDTSQEPWIDAPHWQKSSAVDGVLYHLRVPDAGPEASHENWMAQKDRDGWTWGPKKDPEAKTHPCMVPFDKLPPEQQAKDHLFRAIVRALRPFIAAAV